jgi:CheY-like chemotaxis protein
MALVLLLHLSPAFLRAMRSALMQKRSSADLIMDKCPRCGAVAVFAGYEDARTFYQCENCKRVWTTTVTAAPEGPRAPIHVLVADDSDQMVGLIASWLEDEGYPVVTATTGRQALDAAAVHHPDVVLLDLIMPPPNGFEVCSKLMSLQPPPEIILMTGVSDAAHLDRVSDLGAVTLLRKPFEAETVVAAVRSAVSKREIADRGRETTNSHG